ncbi:MAG: dihydrolipoyl dehydrogenase [Desulfobacterales bacterium]|nr:dihydrolipoyl dehydrogenase [Desulfobacterales bacterium]
MDTKLTILGAGPGGYVAAIKAASKGIKVTLIEKENLGGTCLNHGCIPSKIMKNSSDLFFKTQNAAQFGVNINGDIDFDINVLMKRKEKIIETQRKGIEDLLKKNGINLLRGKGFIKDKGLINVELSDGGTQKVIFEKLILATGTKPLNMQAFPFDHKRILSSDDLLRIDNIPESITIVGGGVIGCEFAFILAGLGTKVTIIEALSRLLPLPSVDESISKVLQREMKKKKIKVITGMVVEAAEAKEGNLSLTLGKSPFLDNVPSTEIAKQNIETEKIVVCVGRTPLASEIGLENIGLKTTKNGWIGVNDFLETEIEGVYAIGDILGPSKVMLAHVASNEGMVAVDNIMGNVVKMKYNAIPGAIFTSPEIGTIGLSESEALKQGFDINSFSVNFRTLGKAQAIGEIAGEAKIIIENKTEKILGVHIIGPHATDLIAEGALAVNKGLTASDLANTIHAHPTLAEIMSEAALKACGNPLHG